MARLLSIVNTNINHPVGRWRIRSMLKYLQMSLQIFTEGMVVHMVQYGYYDMIIPSHSFYCALYYSSSIS